MVNSETHRVVFVYGTLMRGDCRHGAIKSQQFIAEALSQPRYRIYDLGSYPGIIECENGGNQIQGELYNVDEQCLANLDEIEAVSEGLYERKSILLCEPFDALDVEAYFYLGDLSQAIDIGTRWSVRGQK